MRMNTSDKQILIVEDNNKNMEKLCEALKDIKDVYIHKAKNSEQAYRYALEYNIDLFIVDIILNTKVFADISGLKFIESIRSINDYKFTPIIVTTSLEDPKFHAYSNLHCFRYYEKPYDYAEFKKSVVEALEYTTPKKAKDFYYYKDDGVIYSIKTKNIVYFQTNNRITYIQCRNGKVMPTPYKSNKKILLELNSKKFLRCSNNTIVNAEYIEGIDKSNRYVMLVDGFGTLEIGPKLKKKFLEEFFKC